MAVPAGHRDLLHMLLALPDGRLGSQGRRVGDLGGLRRGAADRPGAGRRRPPVPGLGRGPDLGAGRGVRAPRGAAAVPGGQRQGPAADAVDGRGRDPRRRRRAGGRGPARAGRVAGPGRGRGRGLRGAARARHDRRRGARARALRGPGAGPGAVVAGFTVVVAAIYLVIVLGIGTQPHDTGRPRDPRAVHAGRRRGRDRVPAGQGTAGGLRDPLRLRRQGGTGRDAPHLRQPPDPGHSHGRAAAAAGRVAAQDHGPDQRRGLHRHRRRAGARGRGARHRAQVGRGHLPGAPGGGQGRGVRQRVGLGLAAVAAGRARAGASCGWRRSATPASCSG